MGQDGRERLGTSAEFGGILDTRIARSELTDNQARDFGEFVERLQDNGSQGGLIVLAPHGGDIERHTDEQAERAAARLGARRASVGTMSRTGSAASALRDQCPLGAY
jgi:hypothetical protein